MATTLVTNGLFLQGLKTHWHCLFFFRSQYPDELFLLCSFYSYYSVITALIHNLHKMQLLHNFHFMTSMYIVLYPFPPQIATNNSSCATDIKSLHDVSKQRLMKNRFCTKVHTLIVDRTRSADANKLPF